MRRTVHLEDLAPNTAWRLYSELVNVLGMEVVLVTGEEAGDTYKVIDDELVPTDTLFGKGYRVIESGVDISPDGVELHRILVPGEWGIHVSCNRFTIKMA